MHVSIELKRKEKRKKKKLFFTEECQLISKTVKLGYYHFATTLDVN